MAEQQGRWAWIFMVLMFVLCCSSSLLTIRSQSAITDLVYGSCDGTVATEGTFATNRNEALRTLQGDASRFLYSWVHSPSSNGSDDVYGMYQCRGDLSLAQCGECVSTILSAASPYCLQSVGARLFLRGCYLRYEHTSFRADPDFTMVSSNCSNSADKTNIGGSSTSSGSGQAALYRANLGAALNLTAQEAPSHSGYFSTATQGSGQTTAYALAQCMGYISPSQCASCLSQVSNFFDICQDSLAGELYFVTCNYVYGNGPLLFNATIAQKKQAYSSTRPLVIRSTVAGMVLSVAAALLAALICRRRIRRGSQVSCHAPDEYASLSDHFGQIVSMRGTSWGEGGFGSVLFTRDASLPARR